MEWMRELLDPNNYYFQQFFALFTSIVSLLILRSFKGRLVNRSKQSFLNASVFSLYLPAKFFLILLSTWHLIELINVLCGDYFQFEKYPIVQLLAVLHLSWYGFRVVNTIESATLNESEPTMLDATAVIGIAKIFRLLLAVICMIAAFDLMGLDPRGLIAVGSVSGAALAFASKDLVSNWFGGVMLYLDKPFKVGDWIRSPDREIEGTVEYIGWRITRIKTFDKRPLYVPNAMFNNITVQNPSRMTHRRINETIGVRYDDVEQVQVIVDAIRAYIGQSDLVDQDQVIIVNFNGFGASSLNIMVYCMTKTIDWVTFHQHKETLLLDIASIIEAHGAEFAFPTQTIKMAVAEPET